MPETRAMKVIVFEEEEMEEAEEKEECDGKRQQDLDHELFKELTEELDVFIDQSMEETYRQTLNAFNQMLNHPCESSDDRRVPTLFLCGHCLNWNWLFDRLRTQHSNLTIENKFYDGMEELAFTANENTECDKGQRKKKKGRKKKLLLFFSSSFLSRREMLARIFSFAEKKVSVFLAVHTSISFASIDEQIPRTFFVQMRILSPILLPSTGNFLLALFTKMKLGLLPKGNVQFHGDTLSFVWQMFLREFKTLGSIRKPLVLALHKYATDFGADRRPNAEERKTFQNVAENYGASIFAFANVCDFPDLADCESIFKLHCQIQNGANFAAFYAKQRQEWDKWTRDKWQNKMATICKFIMDSYHKEKCRELIIKLEELHKRKPIEQSENIAPPKKATVLRSSLRRIPSNTIFAGQQRLRSRLMHPLDENIRAELLQFLDSFFLHTLSPFPAKFVAGTGDLNLMDPSLSGELDHRLADLSNEHGKLDIVNAYQLLVTHSDSFTVQLASLQKAFCHVAEPIDGLDTEARFLCAIAQLEHIGVVKSLANDFVRLIYLPAAALSSDLFENRNK